MRLITVAIHTYDRALALKTLLENEGIAATLQNVNLENPGVSSGVRIRIAEHDLPLALRIIENTDIFTSTAAERQEESHQIIVPVDLSANSMTALPAAFNIAHHHNAEIRFLNSYLDPYVAGNMQLTETLTYEIADNDARRIIAENARMRMADFAEKVRRMIKDGTLPPVKFSTKVMEGVPEDVIVEYAKINPPYLVVMATRPATRKHSDMIGSVTAEVLDKCRFSVLTVPQGIENNKVKRITVFTNLEQEDLLAIDTMARIFNNTTADVLIVPTPERKRPFDRSPRLPVQKIIQYCRENFPSFTFNAAAPDFCTSLQCAGTTLITDLIVIPNKKKNAFARLFNPGLAHKLIVEADIPLLVIPV